MVREPWSGAASGVFEREVRPLSSARPFFGRILSASRFTEELPKFSPSDLGTVPGDPGLMPGDPESMADDSGSMAGDPGSMAGDPGSMADDPGSMADDQGAMPDDLRAMLTSLGEIQAYASSFFFTAAIFTRI
jgi:hypothetical protein